MTPSPNAAPVVEGEQYRHISRIRWGEGGPYLKWAREPFELHSLRQDLLRVRFCPLALLIESCASPLYYLISIEMNAWWSGIAFLKLLLNSSTWDRMPSEKYISRVYLGTKGGKSQQSNQVKYSPMIWSVLSFPSLPQNLYCSMYCVGNIHRNPSTPTPDQRCPRLFQLLAYRRHDKITVGKLASAVRISRPQSGDDRAGSCKQESWGKARGHRLTQRSWPVPLPHLMIVAQGGLMELNLEEVAKRRGLHCLAIQVTNPCYADSFGSVGFLGSCMVWKPGMESTGIWTMGKRLIE